MVLFLKMVSKMLKRNISCFLWLAFNDSSVLWCEQRICIIATEFIKTEYAIVNIKNKTTDLLKNHIYSKNEAFRE